MFGRSEYQVEYCGMRGESISKSGKGEVAAGVAVCNKDEDVQPVGGISQARARDAARLAAAQQSTMQNARGLPAYDEMNTATIYSGSDRGTHRVQPEWKDPRWSDQTRAQMSTLYNPAGRDPPNRNNYYVYRTAEVDAVRTPAHPLAVPDVHKLRYMHNNYMTKDDWY